MVGAGGKTQPAHGLGEQLRPIPSRPAEAFHVPWGEPGIARERQPHVAPPLQLHGAGHPPGHGSARLTGAGAQLLSGNGLQRQPDVHPVQKGSAQLAPIGLDLRRRAGADRLGPAQVAARARVAGQHQLERTSY